MKAKNNKKARFLSDDFTRVIILILGCVCSTLVLTFSVLTIVAVTKSNFDDAPNFLFWVFISMGLSSLVTYMRNRSRYNLIRVIILFAFNLALGIVVTYAKNDTYLFSLTAGLYCLVVIVSRIFNIIEKKSIRAIVFNAIVILIAMLLGVGLFIPVEVDDLAKVVLIECLFITITALAEVAGIAFGELKFKVLFKIIVKTFALEVLFGLIATMVASALVLITVEDTITNFGDALWYCFAVVTTIGFGDFPYHFSHGRHSSIIHEKKADSIPVSAGIGKNLLIIHISELCRGKTLIVIAHRLNTIRNANKILVIKNGQIVESGSHEELMAANKEYAMMVSKQTIS